MSTRNWKGVLVVVGAAALIGSSVSGSQTGSVPASGGTNTSAKLEGPPLIIRSADLTASCNSPRTSPGASHAECGRRQEDKKNGTTAKTIKGFRPCQPSRRGSDQPSSSWPARSEPAIALCRP